MIGLEIITALSAISGILGITAKDIVSLFKENEKRSRSKSLSSENLYGFDAEINGLVMYVLFEFIWYKQTNIRLQKESNYEKKWKAREYDILEDRINEKLNNIGYTASVYEPSIVILDSSVSFVFNAEVVINEKTKARTFTF